jgi:hypothetical protein
MGPHGRLVTLGLSQLHAKFLDPAFGRIDFVILLLMAILGRDERGCEANHFGLPRCYNDGQNYRMGITHSPIAVLLVATLRTMNLVQTKVLRPIQRHQEVPAENFVGFQPSPVDRRFKLVLK